MMSKGLSVLEIKTYRISKERVDPSLFLFYTSGTKKDPVMEKEKLKLIVRNLRLLVDALESEVYSDEEDYRSSQYQTPVLDYDEVFEGDDG